MSQKFLQSEKLQTFKVSFSFITFNNILILIISLFQASEKSLLLKIQTESSRFSNSTPCLGSAPFSRGSSRLMSRSCSWMSTTSPRWSSESWSRLGSWCSTLPSRCSSEPCSRSSIASSLPSGYLSRSCSILSQLNQLRPQNVFNHVHDAQMDESSGTNFKFFNLETYFNFYFNSFRMFYPDWSQVFLQMNQL